MTATLVVAEPLGGIVTDTDLWFPGQADPVGFDPMTVGGYASGRERLLARKADPLRYVVWVDTGRPHGNGREFHRQTTSLPELAPRLALHVNHGRPA